MKSYLAFMQKIISLFALLLATSTPAFADITISDAYARVASPMAMAGAVFLKIENSGTSDDHLIGATSTAAKRVELHTHQEVDGVMQMRHEMDGFQIPAEGSHMLKRGGDHVMFMGLTDRWAHGDSVPLTLTFKNAGEITLNVIVDLERAPEMEHGEHNH